MSNQLLRKICEFTEKSIESIRDFIDRHAKACLLSEAVTAIITAVIYLCLAVLEPPVVLAQGKITVTPQRGIEYEKLLEAPEELALDQYQEFRVCEVSAADYTNNWLSSDLQSLKSTTATFCKTWKQTMTKGTGKIVIPSGTAVTDLYQIKIYCWHEEDENAYVADHFVFIDHGDVYALERISTNHSSIAIRAYSGKLIEM